LGRPVVLGAQKRAEALKLVRAGCTKRRAAAWYLERRNPRDFGKPPAREREEEPKSTVEQLQEFMRREAEGF
jgi:hypothetical protein